MRKFLLAMTAMLIAVIGHAAPEAGTSEAFIMYTQNGVTVNTVTVSVNDDPGLQHLTIKDQNGSSGDFSWGAWITIKIEGTGISQAGLEKISDGMTNSGQSAANCTLDIQESDFTEAISSIPNKFSKLLLAPGKAMPSVYVLEASTKLKYAYSGEKDGDKTIHIYASEQITSVDSISELADIETLGEGWTVYLSGRNEAIETALREKGVTVEYAKEAFNGTLVINGEEDIEELIKSALPEGESLSAIKTLIIKGHTISQTELDYLAAQLADVHTMNLADATMPDDVRLNDNSETAHWITLVLPRGTKISPNFKKYDKLRYAVGGALEKIWIINRDGAGSLRSSDIASILPDGINTPKEGLRLGVAFVGPTNLDDIKYLVGESNAPLNSARIWHFYNAEGLTEDDFNGLEKLTFGTYDNMTSIVLPPGFDIDHILKILEDSYRIGNIYSLSDGDNGRTLTVNVKNTETFDIARFATVDTRIVVLKGGKAVDNNIINALNSTKRAVCVDLSEMSLDSDEILSNVKNGSVMYVQLPSGTTFDIDHYDGTTFGVIARIESTRYDGFAAGAVCYQRVPGTLNKTAGYLSQEILEHEHIRYRGLFDMHDIEHLLANNENVYCDMSDVHIVMYKNGEIDENKKPNEFSTDMVTDVPDKDMSKLSNAYIKYLALPVGTTLPDDMEAFKANNPELLGIGTFDKTSQELAFHSYAENGGAAKSVVTMLTDDGDKITEDTPVKRLTMSGHLNFDDISGSQAYNDDDGHYSKESGTKGGALNEATTKIKIQLEECDFENAIFPVQTDMTFSGASVYTDVLDIKLPTSPEMTLIPENCMDNFRRITELCIPADYEVIGSYAFREMLGLKKITTTVNEDGYITDRGEGTIVLPYNLKEIGYGAFHAIDHIYDIYVLSEKAPKCASGAFDANMYWGNAGFKGNEAHPIQRNNYKTNERIIGMLHYPHTIVGSEEEKKYTDVTRKYTLLDETGALNGKGALLVLPKHREFRRSYGNATCHVTVNGVERGCNWNTWKEFDENGALIIEPEGAILPELTEENTYDLDYAGWHEFVLADNYHAKAPNGEVTPDFSKFTEQDWYTVCFTYNMTRSQLLKYFGVPAGKVYTNEDGTTTTAKENIYPDVRTLVEVRRHQNYSADGGLITFVFTDNLITAFNGEPADVNISLDKVNHTDGKYYMKKGQKPWEYIAADLPVDEGFEDDPIIIKGGYPYIIKPYLSTETDIDDVHFLPVEGNTVGRRYTVTVNGREVAAPCTEHIVHAIDTDNSTDEEEVYATDGSNKYLYHFIGTYGYNLIDESGKEKSPTLPQYSFFISKTKSNPKHLLYRTMKEGINWGSFTSIIGGRSEAEIIVPSSIGGASSTADSNIALRFICKNDDFTDDNGNAKSTVLSMAFNESDSDSATGITEHTTQKTKANISAIYSITGKYMGTSTDNLPKGIYISNGKKHIVQ